MSSLFRKSGLHLAVILMVLCCSCAGPESGSGAAGPETVKTDDVETKTEKTAPVEAKPTPVEAKPAPVEAKPAPVEAKPVPVEAKPVPVEAKPVPVEAKPAPPEPRPEEPPAPDKPVAPSDVVAEIDGHTVTRGEFEKRLAKENRGKPDFDRAATKLTEAETVLLKMLGEKAMIIEGRQGNLREKSSRLKEFYEQQMVQALLQVELADKVKVTEAEIDAKVKGNPKLDRARAKSALQVAKGKQAVGEYFDELSKKRNLQKLRYNFPKAAQIHQRLLYRPQAERKIPWITHAQMDNELEKNIPLATFDGGQVTIRDWFERLNMSSPPKRPKDLGTVEGVERLLDDALRTPVLAAEARSRGVDKDESFLKRIAPREERIIFSEVRRKLLADISEPTEEQVRAYFNNNKEKFKTADQLRIDQIWCENLEAAQKAKSELEVGKDFGSVKQEYSLDKDKGAFATSASREGIFFKDLWSGEPNEIVGPLKGFHDEQLRWRVVRIIKKTPGAMREWSESLAKRARSTMRREQRNAKIEGYQKELLAKYPYRIHRVKIEDLDPLSIP
ncbi:MAG: peptidyl-prolyl cis-trans isomerase [Planctomycetota bacterium]